MITLGLTGLSGAGKSTVAEILRGMGSLVLDADKTAHDIILRGQPAYHDIVEAFGTGILNEKQEIDRKSLGRIVFADKEKLGLLEKLTHTHIIRRHVKDIERASVGNVYAMVVLDAPLLIQAGLHKLCGPVWIVTADFDVRARRIMARDRLSYDEVNTRLNAQTPLEDLLPYADLVIENNNDLGALTHFVTEHARNLMQ